jgi:hypothetical protein
MCGGGPKVQRVDAEAERRKAEAEATARANEQLLSDARRKRQQKGVLATGANVGGGVLASGAGQQ